MWLRSLLGTVVLLFGAGCGETTADIDTDLSPTDVVIPSDATGSDVAKPDCWPTDRVWSERVVALADSVSALEAAVTTLSDSLDQMGAAGAFDGACCNEIEPALSYRLASSVLTVSDGAGTPIGQLLDLSDAAVASHWKVFDPQTETIIVFEAPNAEVWKSNSVHFETPDCTGTGYDINDFDQVNLVARGVNSESSTVYEWHYGVQKEPVTVASWSGGYYSICQKLSEPKTTMGRPLLKKTLPYDISTLVPPLRIVPYGAGR